MKLIYCEKCQDVVRLFQPEMRYCQCRLCGGKYIGKSLAVVFGGPLVLGLTWSSLIVAMRYYKDSCGGRLYDPRLDLGAFIIPLLSPKVLRFETEKLLTEFLEGMRKADEEVLNHD